MRNMEVWNYGKSNRKGRFDVNVEIWKFMRNQFFI